MRLIGFSLGMAGTLWLVGCSGGVRSIDLESKQFQATVNIDSTRGLDSTRIAELSRNKVIYSFSKDGEGQQHTQMGMLSHDTSFSWQLQGDSLRLDEQLYAIQKTDMGFKLKSDSALIFLQAQP
ncbi:hypothetical protein ACFSUS_20195 [Spirosoma soli]|uniref:Lipocalin family protein n=1 Tax=Spirosoma soli TaxID=1770529 RepID=A0ABW5M7M1_9BACT